MSDQQNEADAGLTLLPERMDHAACFALRPEIEKHLGKDLRFSAANVDFVGGAGAELLLAAQADCAIRGLSFEIQSPSEAFQSGLGQLGLTDAFLSIKG